MPAQTDRLNTALAGRYRIDRHLGEGGMASVYLCEDIKHKRKVALKLLKPELAAVLGAERFVQEITTTAALQHPHILPLFDSGTADGFLFYVMPFIDGETLREKLNRETQLGVDESVRIAREVLDALEYAHQHGIVHRDVKPENILLHGGHAMVADFGIALAVSAAAGGRMTETGLSLGTPHYMSPEQATAEKEITARSDVYSLGSVLYEMLTGQPPHLGGSAQQIIMKIITEAPAPVTQYRKSVPPNVAGAVAKALEKLPADRFESAKAFSEALGNAAYANAAIAHTAGGAIRGRSGLQRFVGATPLVWALLAASVAIAAYAATRPANAPTLPMLSLALTDIPGVDPRNGGGGVSLAISPDGSRLAFAGSDSTKLYHLFVRSLSDGSVVSVPQSEAGNSPAFSPDGRTLAFHRPGSAPSVWVVGETVVKPAGAPTPAVRGITWDSDTTIVYASQRKLFRARVGGGASTLVAEPPDSGSYQYPHGLQAGRVLLSTNERRGAGELIVLSLRDRSVTPLGIAGSRPSYVDGGIITFVDANGTVMGVDVDPGTLKPRGTPRLITESSSSGRTGNAHAVARNGVLVVHRSEAGRLRELVIVDRSGKAERALGALRPFRAPRFSPEGNRIAVGIEGRRGTFGDVYVVKLGAGTIERVTADSASAQPEWDPDGRSVVYVQLPDTVAARPRLSRMPVDGSGAATVVLARPFAMYESHITPDRRTIVWREDRNVANRDIYFAPLDSPAVAHPLRTSDFDDRGFAMSPDGKWIAYTSNEKGSPEVYICRVESNGPRWLVSKGGGSEPRWAKSGELFFRNGDTVLVTRVELGAEPKIAAPAALFTGAYSHLAYEPLWDVAPDGKRFVMVRQQGGEAVRLDLMINWMERWRAGGTGGTGGTGGR